MTIIAERAYAYYRKHPAAASIALNDGDALDAGTAIDIESNISWLEYEGPRHLVASLGRTVASYKAIADAYVGFGDIATARFGIAAPSPHQELFWTRNVCARFGPFSGIADIQDSAGRAFLRPVEMDIDVFSTVASFTSTDLYYAMTASPDPAQLYAGHMLASSGGTVTKVSGLGSGHKTHNNSTSVVLTPNIPITPAMAQGWTCRSTSTYGATIVPVFEFYLWFGWRFINASNNPGYINAMSAWETRAGTE